MEFPVVLLKLDQISTLEEALNKLIAGANLDQRPDRVEWPSGDTLQKRWLNASTEVSLGVNEINSGTDERFKYIYVQALVERAKTTVKGTDGRFLDRLDRINKVTSDALFFEHNNSIYTALYMNYTKSSMSKINFIIKDLFVESIWGSITPLPAEYNISDSVYYWLLSKFLIGDKIISGSPAMTIQSFTGYSGAAADNAHFMSGEGEKISALLGTLAFIFGDDSLKSLKLHVCVNAADDDNYDNTLVEIEQKGNIRVYEYDGPFCIGTPVQEKILQTLLIYKKIIPQILNEYNSAVRENEWGDEKKKDFIKTVGEMIVDRVLCEIEERKDLEDKLSGNK